MNVPLEIIRKAWFEYKEKVKNKQPAKSVVDFVAGFNAGANRPITIYIFTASCQDHGTCVISATKHKPTIEEQWKLLTNYIYTTNDLHSEDDLIDYLNQ